jgi:phosphonate metabolism protein PhnN/1,5-bisphosphokinase (PRPP-forming)
MSGRGTLVLVVGPSGAGKDSIIAGAADALRDDRRFVFARRLITRPAEAGGEDHIALSAAEFAARRTAGELLLHWRAHGLDYGLPGALAAALAGGRSVVANVSRTVTAAARQRLAPVTVVAITASPETLAARLAARGREDATDIDSRLRRAAAWSPDRADAVIDNDGALDAAVARFVAVLRQVVAQPASR